MQHFWRGFEKQAFLAKRPYKTMPFHKLNPEKKDEVWTAKIDGAHAIIKLEEGKTPQLFSHRISKRTGNPIEYNAKLPHVTGTSPVTALVRGEVFAVDKDGRPAPPEIVAAMLNRGPERSLELQRELGLKTQVALIDVDKIGDQDAARLPYEEKRTFLEAIAKKSQDFVLPHLARTQQEKKDLLAAIVAGSHHQTGEGVITHHPTAAGAPFAKAKIVDDHDVYVTGVFAEEETKPGRAPMAGGITYAWTPGGETKGRIGTGFDHAEKAEMLKNPEQYIGRVAKAKALGISKNKVLLKPAFHGWHIDKNLD